MKKIILSVALIATSILFASTKKKQTDTKISKQAKIEIANTTAKTVYFWEVNTLTGRASGYTVSEAQAKKTIKLMSTNDIVMYKIIESYKGI